jgi:hypothetical protein
MSRSYAPALPSDIQITPDAGGLTVAGHRVPWSRREVEIVRVAHILLRDGLDLDEVRHAALDLPDTARVPRGVVLAACAVALAARTAGAVLDSGPPARSVSADRRLLAAHLGVPLGSRLPRGTLAALGMRALGRTPTRGERDALSRCWRGREALGPVLRQGLAWLGAPDGPRENS